MAEREGFEPSVPSRAQRFSRPPDSTTLAPLRDAAKEISRFIRLLGPSLTRFGTGSGRSIELLWKLNQPPRAFVSRHLEPIQVNTRRDSQTFSISPVPLDRLRPRAHSPARQKPHFPAG